MQSRSTSAQPGERSGYTPSPTPAESPARSGEPPATADAHGNRATTGEGEVYARVSQAVMRAVAARHAALSTHPPARRLSREEEVFINLQHGCQG